MEQVKRFQRQINTKNWVPNGCKLGSGLEDGMHNTFFMMPKTPSRMRIFIL